MYIINPDVIDKIPEGYKECTRCHRIMPLTVFHYYKPKAKIKKHRSECIECERLRNALNRAAHCMKDPDYWNNYMKDWYANQETSKQREQRLNRYKKFRKNNPNYYKEYYWKNREHILQLQKESRERVKRSEHVSK